MKDTKPPYRGICRVGGSLELDGKDGRILPQTQEQFSVGHQVSGMAHVEPGQAGTLGGVLNQGASLPEDQGQGIWARRLFGQPGGIIPEIARPL